MVNDVVSAKNLRISEKLPKLLRIRRMNHGTVRTDSTYVMNPPILNSNLKIDEHDVIVIYFCMVHITDTYPRPSRADFILPTA